MPDPTAELPHALGGPCGNASIKLSPDDFVVDEVLGFEPSGEGEHVFLRIEKRGENTEYLARQIARFAQTPVRNVSYAGLKDRHGRTSQWFSVQLPGQAGPDWSGFETESVRILEITRNQRKLRRGAAAGNRFELTLRHLDGAPDELESRLNDIARAGVPNYFGPQRFGRERHNLDAAKALFRGELSRANPHQRGLYLSAARSEIFNRILAERVKQGNWDTALDGDVFMFAGSQSFFMAEAMDEDIQRRVRDKAIHPSGVLWGNQPSMAAGAALAIENQIADSLSEFAAGLATANLETSRRPFRLCPDHLDWNFDAAGTMRLSFVLPSGAYATTVLRELVTMTGFEG